MINSKKQKTKIILGVTGSVAAIKTLEVYTLLSEWAEVKLVATQAAHHFLKTIPKIKLPIIDDKKEWQHWQKKGDAVLHIDLKKWADILVIAPLSANTLAKIDAGQCDNLLTNICRAWDFKKPIYLAPAMNTAMWEHPVTGKSIKNVKSWGYQVIKPISKILACGDEGIGAMAEPIEINKVIKKNLAIKKG